MNSKIKNMTRGQLIDLFDKNGLSNYQLKNTGNLLKTFGINILWILPFLIFLIIGIEQ